jgi:hypothetical protein
MTWEPQTGLTPENRRPIPSKAGRWPKGKSGNPGGRPKGLAARVRELTKDGHELVDLMVAIMRGTLTVTLRDRDGKTYEQAPSHRDRMMAAAWLADRGFGKVVDAREHEYLDEADLRERVVIAIGQLIAQGKLNIPDDTRRRLLEQRGAIDLPENPPE